MVHVGPVCQRAAVGDRSRGLQRRRRGVGLPAPRSRPLACLPLGRGGDGRVLRRRTEPVPGSRAVERPRPDPQGADVRAHRRPGQPRRGRQGALVVPRRVAEPRLEPLAVPLSPAGVPVRGADRRERATGQARPRVRAARHGRLRRRLLDRRGRLHEGRCVRPADDGAGHQRRLSDRPTPHPADRVVPQHLVVGPRRRPSRPAPRARRGDRHRPSVPRRARVAGRPRSRRARADPAVLRERDQRGSPLRRRGGHALSEGRHQRPRRRRSPHREPRPARDQGRALVRRRHRRRRDRRGAPAVAADLVGARAGGGFA